MNVDFAIIGSSPKAAILACMLAKTHAKSVLLISKDPHNLRPQHGFDISVAPITNPKTWKILKSNIPKTIEFMNKTSSKNIKTKITERIDPLFITTEQAGKTAFSHCRNLATGYGFNVEKQAQSEQFLSSYKFTDATRLLRRPFFASLEQRLKNCNVQRLDPNKIRIKNKKDDIEITSNKISYYAKQVVLVDDNALLNHLPDADISTQFIKTSIFGFLSEPIKSIKNPIIFNIDNGLIIHQRENGSLDCLAPKNKQTLEQQICLMLNKEQSTRIAGKTQFNKLYSPDGAPLFGKIGRSRYISICNFGTTGLFQTPAIAAMLSENSNEFEQQYFSSLAPKSKTHKRENIAQYCSIVQNSTIKKKAAK